MHGCANCSSAYSNVLIHLIILIFVSIFFRVCRKYFFLQVGLWATRQQDVPTPPLVTRMIRSCMPQFARFGPYLPRVPLPQVLYSPSLILHDSCLIWPAFRTGLQRLQPLVLPTVQSFLFVYVRSFVALHHTDGRFGPGHGSLDASSSLSLFTWQKNSFNKINRSECGIRAITKAW